MAEQKAKPSAQDKAWQLARAEQRKQARELRERIRSRAWTLAQREYPRLITQIEQRLAAGALDAAGLDTWEPEATNLSKGKSQ